jgi:PadR family transcriptional regulator, regulator of vanillate utilization
MSLRYALLALLTAKPMTGYDLAKAFHSSVGHVWHAPDSQIYPALRAMEQEGLIGGTPEARGSSATRIRYHITEAGLDDFRRWMQTPIDYVPVRDPAALRAAYLEWTDPSTARAMLAAHRAHFLGQRDQAREQLTQIHDRRHPMIIERLGRYPESQWERIIAYKAFTYEGMVARAQVEIDWAEAGIRLIDEIEGPDADGSDSSGSPGDGRDEPRMPRGVA